MARKAWLGLTAAMVAEAGSKSHLHPDSGRLLPHGRAASGSCYKETTVFAGVVHRDNLAAYIPIAAEMIAQPRSILPTSSAAQ